MFPQLSSRKITGIRSRRYTKYIVFVISRHRHSPPRPYDVKVRNLNSNYNSVDAINCIFLRRFDLYIGLNNISSMTNKLIDASCATLYRDDV